MTFGHPALRQCRVEAVEAEHDDAARARASQSLAPPPPAQREAYWPQQHRENAGRDCGEQRQERADQRKPGAGPDIRVRGVRGYEQTRSNRSREHDHRELGDLACVLARASRFRPRALPVPIQLAVHDRHHAIDVQLPAEEAIQALRKCARIADSFVVADREKFHVAFDLHEDPDVREVPFVVRASLVVVDGVLFGAPLQHHVLRRQNFAEVALAQDHLVVVVERQRLQQVGDHLDRLAARLVQP